MKIKHVTNHNVTTPAVIDRRLLPQAFVQGNHPQEAHFIHPAAHAAFVVRKPVPGWKRANLTKET
jgi:hypothetical protein